MSSRPAEATTRVPDILDVIAALSSDAVPTPPILARALLDQLPADVWSNPNYRWLDPATKSGSILREVARRLMEGLAAWEPNEEDRAEHILRNMVFGCGITQVHGEMTRRSVYASRDASGSHALIEFTTPDGQLPFVPADHDYPLNKDGKAHGQCRVCKAPIGLERGDTRENYAYAFIHGAYPTEEMQDMQFDVIVGNPPYQIGMQDAEGKKTANILPLYQLFIDRAIALNPKYIAMITPSRWFTGGKGLGDFRSRMLEDRRIRSIVDNPKLFDCFPGVEIKGGVNYFLWDRDYAGDCAFSTRIDGEIVSTVTRDIRDGNGVLIRDNKAAVLVKKVLAKTSGNLGDVVSPQDPFGQSLKSNFKGSSAEPFKGSVPLVFGSHVGFIREDQIERKQEWVPMWKVLMPKAGDGHGREVSYVLGEPIALAPGSACTQTYLVAGTFKTRKEAQNYAHFLATKFVRFLVLQRKVTQNVTPDCFRFVPSLSMKRAWTDKDLYEHFGLTGEEIDYIESTIHPREPIMSLDSAIPATHLPGGAKYREGKARDEAEAALPSDADEGDV